MAVASSTHAQTVSVSDLANSIVGDVIVNNDVPSQSIAQSFTTGSDPSTLFSVTLQIGVQFLNIANGGGGFSVSLYDDNNGLPGASLAVLTGNDTPSFEALLSSYTPSVSTPLTASTPYWIVASVPQPSPLQTYGLKATAI
ncbi:MAG: hypothetical protein EXS36_12030 [Pedosphaera sp.]|nr:hypothetical protein [Pedosphaera sp.]